MNWRFLERISDIDLLIDSENQNNSTFVIFKHSTRCSISSVAKTRLEYNWEKVNPEVPIYIVDLIRFRELSNYIAERFKVVHQSPQLILVENSNATFDCSHLSINSKQVASKLA